MTLPNLEELYVEWDSGYNWLRGFCGAKIEINFRPMPGSAPISGFLEEFQSIELTTSVQHTLTVQFPHFAVMGPKLLIPAHIQTNDETRDRVLLS